MPAPPFSSSADHRGTELSPVVGPFTFEPFHNPIGLIRPGMAKLAELTDPRRRDDLRVRCHLSKQAHQLNVVLPSGTPNIDPAEGDYLAIDVEPDAVDVPGGLGRRFDGSLNRADGLVPHIAMTVQLENMIPENERLPAPLFPESRMGSDGVSNLVENAPANVVLVVRSRAHLRDRS